MYVNGKNLFVVGGTSNKGVVGIYDGSQWKVKQTYAGTSNDLPKMKAISGVSSLEVYAVGGTLLLRYTGTDWQEYPATGAEVMEAVAGMGNGVAFVGRGDSIYKFSGGTFGSSPMATPLVYDFRAIWPHSGQAFAVGSSGSGAQSIIFYDASNWVAGNAPTATLLSVFGSGLKDVFAVGSTSTILHYDGSSWTEPWLGALPATNIQLQDVWVDSSGTVGYAVGATSNVWKFTRCP